MDSSDVFTGGRPLCTQIYLDRDPSTFPRFDTIPECYGQTDTRADGFAVAYTALAKLALRRAVKKRR